MNLSPLLTVWQGSCKLPLGSRPEEFIMWFKHARPNTTPDIGSVRGFEKRWIRWWSAIQPEWRDTEVWPFRQEDTTGQRDWGNLPNGGKLGLILVVTSLGWWIHVKNRSEDLAAQDSEDSAQDSEDSEVDVSEDSKLDDAIADVTWVIDNLISFLSIDAIDVGAPSHTDSDPAPDSRAAPPPKKKRPRTVKIGPPARGAKRIRKARS